MSLRACKLFNTALHMIPDPCHSAFAAHSTDIVSVSCSPCGQFIASGGSDGSVSIWSWDLVHKFTFTHSAPMVAVAFNPAAPASTPMLASCSAVDFAVWTMPSTSLRKIRISSSGSDSDGSTGGDTITSAAWSSDGALLAIGLASGGVSLRDMNGNELIALYRVTPEGQANSSAAVADLTWMPRLTEADSDDIAPQASAASSFAAVGLSERIGKVGWGDGGGGTDSGSRASRTGQAGADAAITGLDGTAENDPTAFLPPDSLAVVYSDGTLVFFGGVEWTQQLEERQLGLLPVSVRHVTVSGGDFLLIGVASGIASTTAGGGSFGAAAPSGDGADGGSQSRSRRITAAILCSRAGVRLTALMTQPTSTGGMAGDGVNSPHQQEQQQAAMMSGFWRVIPRPVTPVASAGGGTGASRSSAQVLLAGSDGSVTLYTVSLSTVHGLYRHLYAFRDNSAGMTDVVVQHLLSGQRVRIRCRDYVRKIAVHRDQLAIQLPDRILVYRRHRKRRDGSITAGASPAAVGNLDVDHTGALGDSRGYDKTSRADDGSVEAPTAAGSGSKRGLLNTTLSCGGSAGSQQRSGRCNGS